VTSTDHETLTIFLEGITEADGSIIFFMIFVYFVVQITNEKCGPVTG